MTIDSACGRFTATYWQVHLIRRALWVPGWSMEQFSLNLNKDFADRVIDSIEKILATKPIMELTDEYVEKVLMSHVTLSEQKYCRFYPIGHPRQIRRNTMDHWELVYKRTKYSTPSAIIVYPVGHHEPDFGEDSEPQICF